MKLYYIGMDDKTKRMLDESETYNAEQALKRNGELEVEELASNDSDETMDLACVIS